MSNIPNQVDLLLADGVCAINCKPVDDGLFAAWLYISDRAGSKEVDLIAVEVDGFPSRRVRCFESGLYFNALMDYV